MNKKRIALTLFLAIISELTNKLVPLITLYFVASRLGPSAFGISQFSFWLLDWGIFFTVYGFSQVGPIMLSQATAPTEESLVHGKIVAARLALSLLSATALIALVQEIADYAPYKWAIISSISILFTSAIDASWILIAKQRMALWSVVSVIAKIFSLAAILYFVQTPADSIRFVVITNLANSLMSIVSFIIAIRLTGLKTPSATQITQALKIATPFALSTMMMLVLDRYDLFLVERNLGASDTGIYSAASKLVASFSPVILTIATVFYSEMMGHHDRDAVERHLKASIFWTFSAIAPAIVGVWFVDTQLLSVIFGAEFSGGASILSLLMTATIFLGIITIFGFQLLTLRRMWKPLIYGLGLGALSGMLIGSTFITQFGMTAVAWSSLVAKLITAVFLGYVAIRVWGFNGIYLIKHTMRATLPALLMGLSLAALLHVGFLERNLYHISMVGGCVYVMFFVGLNLQDIKEFSHKLRRGLELG